MNLHDQICAGIVLISLLIFALLYAPVMNRLIPWLEHQLDKWEEHKR